MRKAFIGICFVLLLSCYGCSTVTTNTITQISTIDALIAGTYDGSMSCGQLQNYGNFGIGTFDRLDGEMIITDGMFFQVKADGIAYMPDTSILTPFASVCYFTPDKCFSLRAESDYQEVERTINNVISNENVFCAIKIHGRFSRMKTRSVPAQTKPYPPLVELTKNQPVFDLDNINGTIIGFRCPAFVKGINVPGYHFHFISDDFTKGGHVLDFVLEEGSCELDICHKYLLILPKEGKGLGHLDLSRDRSKELEEVEK